MRQAAGRADVAVLIKAALAAADPEPLVSKFLASFDFSPFDKIFVLGAGKAGGTMALGVEKILLGAEPDRAAGGAMPDRAAACAETDRDSGAAEAHSRITGGLVVVKDGYTAEGLSQVRQVEAGHPIPDMRGADAARSLLELAGRAGEDDLVICLISGGGSALTALPAQGLTLEDLQKTVAALLNSGARISEVNSVRKHLTMAAAGHLAEASYPAKVLTMIISDVIGDALDVIASGPTVPDESSFADALAVLERYSLMEELPTAIIEHLTAGADGRAGETPKPGDRIFTQVENHILASNRTALKAAASAAGGSGYAVVQTAEPVIGEAREAAMKIVAQALEESSGQPLCMLAGGETTVTVKGCGTGGRAQEFALAAAIAIDGQENTLVFAFGTDGTDGFTDAAGAIADGSTVTRARELGIDTARYLRDNDSHSFFEALGDLIITGPTGTNVNDIYGVIINP
ncbi:MAG: glycerate kinase [Thermoleophilia bacterium]|nr:glycerate kinase [Thermoleophilia bacterium]